MAQSYLLGLGRLPANFSAHDEANDGPRCEVERGTRSDAQQQQWDQNLVEVEVKSLVERSASATAVPCK